ncbi:MAG: hypothetical protein EZS28_017363 [Streblomastix strix]|uniref:Reverse transcriptase domain-containing protein n=1 Tax=Streblomastix strix TaxID=222440 RepID=A0A5J4VXK0_9EUKA|nr:MAG: hypothetical protein EZS28_017363 [Streblomastix strix]
MTGFFQIFKDTLCETRLAATLGSFLFKGIPKTNKLYKKILQTELEEGIIEMTTRELVKCWNPTFIVPKSDGGWRKILEATHLNNEILPLHLQMHGVEDVKMKIQPMDWLIKLDLKSAFHHLTVYEPHSPYLAIEVEQVCYISKGMSFGTQHSPIFFTEAMNRILAEVRKTWDLRIINYSDDILQLHQDQMILKQQPIQLRAGTETGDNVFRLNLKFNNNGTIYAERSKINELGFTQEISKDNFRQSHELSKISGSNNWNFKFSQKTVQGGFSLSDAPQFSTNMSSERTRMVQDDEITDASTARDVLLDQQEIRKQEIFFDIEHFSRDSSYGCSPPRLRSDFGTENGRSSSSMGPLEKGEREMDQQQQGNGSHFLRSSVFRQLLRTIGNEGNSDTIGQLFDSIQSQKTESSTTTSIWSQESIQDNSIFESICINSIRSKSDQLHSRFSEQIGQFGILKYKPTTCANSIPLVDLRANSGLIRKPVQCGPTSLCINVPEGLECAMDRSIQPYIEKRNSPDSPTYRNDILDFNNIQTVLNYSDCDGSLVARPTLIHNTAKENQRWIIL